MARKYAPSEHTFGNQKEQQEIMSSLETMGENGRTFQATTGQIAISWEIITAIIQRETDNPNLLSRSSFGTWAPPGAIKSPG